MNEELTNEVLKAMAKCNLFCPLCGANEVCSKNDWKDTIQAIAAALIEERAKPKLWGDAPKEAVEAFVTWYEKGGVAGVNGRYTRELPKTRTRELAENIVHGINGETHGETKDIEYVESALNKYAEELTNTKETN